MTHRSSDNICGSELDGWTWTTSFALHRSIHARYVLKIENISIILVIFITTEIYILQSFLYFYFRHIDHIRKEER